MSSRRPTEDSKTGRQWRFTWEALAHISTLRLYIFNSEMDDISAVCRFPEAALRLGESLLSISWRVDREINGSYGTSVLMIPVPRVLIDPGRPVDVKVMGDHIEAKLVLLLPVEHPIALSVLGDDASDLNRGLPLSIESGMETFSSEGVNFFCKSCSTKLTRQPLRNFVEAPSTNWQDVADNWFGACCCSFGGVSEKLVSKYMNTFGCKVGMCLFDRASITVCEHDLDGAVLEKAFPDLGGEYSKPKDTSSTSCGFSSELNDTSSTVCRLVSSQSYPDPFTLIGTQLELNMECLKLDSNYCSDYHEKTDSKSACGRTSKCDFCFCTTDKTQSAAGGEQSKSETSSAFNVRLPVKVHGNGFIITPVNISKGIEWVVLSCTNCSSPLGSYPCVHGATSPVDGGIRLFKCYVSASLSVDSDDRFKDYTLQNIFTNLLIEGAQDELSFRTVVCDLWTMSPNLQITLLNSKAWCCSGFCFENSLTSKLPIVRMQPAVKVLFSDYFISPEVNSTPTGERPAQTSSAEVVYMMTRQIEELRRALRSSIAMLPPSCSSLQGASLSFLER